MKDFSFSIEDFRDGWMTWNVGFGEEKFKLRPSFLFYDGIQQLLWAVLGFHPDYDDAIWGMASDRQDENIPCNQIKIDEEGSSAVWDISIIDESNDNQNRMLHMRVFHDLNVSQYTYEMDIPYFDFAEVIMTAINKFLNEFGLVNYFREWGKPFPVIDFINAKALLMRKQTGTLRDDVNIISRPFYVAFMETPMRKFTVVSNNVCFGFPPEYMAITEQRLTITNKGRVNISTKNYLGVIEETKCFYIDKDDAKDIIQDLADYFQENRYVMQATDSGTWDLTFESENGKRYQFQGPLMADEDDFFGEFSTKLRRYLKRRDLFIFDGENQSGIIFLSCEFEGGGRSYYYRTDDETIEVGDYVRVPVGSNGRTAIVEVVDIEYFEENNTPMALDKVKTIIEKVDEFGEYPEDEEDD